MLFSSPDGVNRSKSTGHVAYQIKKNHEMQQRGRNMIEIVQVSLFLLNYGQTDRVWYEINTPYFSKEKIGYNNIFFCFYMQ